MLGALGLEMRDTGRAHTSGRCYDASVSHAELHRCPSGGGKKTLGDSEILFHHLLPSALFPSFVPSFFLHSPPPQDRTFLLI